MESQVVLVHADEDPIPGVVDPGPHQVYRNPRLSVERRELGEVHRHRIRVAPIYAGLCGTDVHVVQTNPETGYIKCSAPLRIPSGGRIIGHEGVARVLEVGSELRHVEPGAVVTFESISVCYHCDACRRGQFNQCRRAKLVGLEVDGLFGTVVDMPSFLTHDVSDLAGHEKGLKAAACVEPAGVAYVACRSTRVLGGDVVVVFGAGPIGLLAAMLCKLVFGASEVHVVEPLPLRRNLARQWSDAVYDVEEFFADPPRSVDVVIEASGALDNVDRVFRCLSANSRVTLLARSGVPLTLSAVDHMITNNVSIVGARGHLGGAFTDILRLYRCGRIPLDAVVTDVVEGPDALAELLASPGGIERNSCKILAHFAVRHGLRSTPGAWTAFKGDLGHVTTSGRSEPQTAWPTEPVA